MAINKAIFQGRLTNDIELKQYNGLYCTSFTLAWSSKYKTKDGKEGEKQCFMLCKAWGKTAEFIGKYLSTKGTEMLVEGELGTNSWMDKDGHKRSTIELNIGEVHFCGAVKKSDGATTQTNPATAQAKEPASLKVDTSKLEDNPLFSDVQPTGDADELPF